MYIAGVIVLMLILAFILYLFDKELRDFRKYVDSIGKEP